MVYTQSLSFYIIYKLQSGILEGIKYGKRNASTKDSTNSIDLDIHTPDLLKILRDFLVEDIFQKESQSFGWIKS